MRQIVYSISIFALVLLLIAAGLFFMLADTKSMSRTEYLLLLGKTASFRYTGLPKLDEAETKFLFIDSCTRKCHGREVVEKTRHTPREWETVVTRMKANGASLTDNEFNAITKYLQKNYLSTVPTILSHESNRFLKQFLWKSDFGESDLYVDVIYTPLEYFKLMGGISTAHEYNIDEHTVFLVYLNTHQNRLPDLPIDKLAVLKDNEGRAYKVIDWKVLYVGSDIHHIEGLLRFEKVKAANGFMELILMDLPGQKERTFHWDIPIPEFKGQ